MLSSSAFSSFRVVFISCYFFACLHLVGILPRQRRFLRLGTKLVSIFKLDLGGVFVIEDWLVLAFGAVCDVLLLSVDSDVCLKRGGACNVVFCDGECNMLEVCLTHIRSDDDIVVAV